jgi:serine/threonine-protein kinase
MSLDMPRQQLQRTLGDSYTIERELGGGGMSRVFIAKDTALGRRVVIKLLSPALAADISVERFIREARIASQLQQANIVPVFSTGVSGGLPYYTMPFVDGLSLRSRLTSTRLPIEEITSVLTDIARALAFAHEHGVVHRDIKPENVLLSGDSAVVTDFGIAKAVSASTTGVKQQTLTEVGAAIGTPAYMSPEQASGDEVDARTDIYSWAVIAYEALTGQHPFAAQTTSAALIRAHIAEKPKALNAVRPEVPSGLVAVVMRSLEKDPNNRPANGRELLSLLTKATTGERIAARSSRRSASIGIAALTAIVVGIAIALSVSRNRQSSEPQASGANLAAPGGNRAEPKAVAVLPFVNVGGDPAQEYFSDGVTDEIADALARIPGLRLASRTSAFAFKGRSDVDAMKIGKELNVGALLEGQVLRAGDMLRISTQLTDSRDGLVLWRNSYQRDMKDVFAVQADIAKSIASALHVTLAGAEPVVAKTGSMQAHDLYLRGRFEHDQYTGESIRRAITLYQKAIALDPRYGDPHAWLAGAWVNLADDFIAPKEAFPAALRAANAALKLDSANAGAYFALAVAGSFTTSPEQRRNQLRKAASLMSSDPSQLTLVSVALLPLDQSPAIQLAQRAYMLDSASQWTTYGYSVVLAYSGREAEALPLLESAIKRGIAGPFVHFSHGDVLLQLGRAREALEAFRTIQPSLADAGRTGMARSYVALGQRDKALALVNALEADAAKRYVSKDYIAQIYAALGDKDRAFMWLERAADDRSGYLQWLGLNPIWAPLRNDARFSALKARLRLP